MILKLSKYPFLKLNLNDMMFKIYTSYHFLKSYDNLPFDNYISEKTRQRRYSNYTVQNINNTINIIHHNKNTFTQNNITRKFEIIENPYDPFIIEFIKLNTQILHNTTNFTKLNIDVHQVRQIAYPNLNSHNSPEGIHQDGSDYIVSALVLKRFNIKGGNSIIYDKDKNEIFKTTLNKYDYILQDDRELYHYVTPIEYFESDGFEGYGHRDILGLDINIIK